MATDPSDVDLVNAVKENQDQGAKLLFESRRPRVFRAVRHRFGYVRDADIVEQAIDDTALKCATTFDPSRGSSLGGWWTFLAQNRVIDLLRGEPPKPTLLDEIVEPCGRESTPLDTLISDETVDLIHRAIEGLPEMERVVVFADLDVGKPANARILARLHDTTEAAITQARFRARKKLKIILKSV